MASLTLKGSAHRYGANINTDEIIPARYLNTSDPDELAKHCMEDLDKDFMKKLKPGDFIVAEQNFGCGSSREHAPIAIKKAGVSAIIASTFARIFFRNAINIGLPILECPAAVKNIKSGDVLSIDLTAGTIKNVTRSEVYQAQPFPPFMQDIIKQGGLLNYLKRR
ncbi:MAG: 3-isopropylmalate dehydratase small subunit [Elusimicrobia bacterium]|nr:3-isopropylmalate dehydratase small subunit [Elusimicrobiota bacterium]